MVGEIMKKTMIFAEKEPPPSDEHIIAYALGKRKGQVRYAFSNWYDEHVRRQQCEVNESDISNPSDDEGENSEFANFVADTDENTHPEKAYLKAELQQVVRRAVDGLPEIYQDVVRLHLLEGFEVKEVAEILQITDDAAKSRVHRAKEMLRERLSDYVLA
jgi:RNA polymerase sigma factor (sigma-70 family)